MSLWFRLLQAIEGVRSRSHLGPLDECRIEMRTWPTDLDFTGHVGDERYLELMKLGRYCLAKRQGILGEMQRRKVTAHVAAAEVQYLDELKMLECFTLCSRIVAWDDKWVYVEHRFDRCGGRTSAVGRAQLVFKHDGETVVPEQVVSWADKVVSSPPIPEEFLRLRTNRPCPTQRCVMRFTEDDLPGLGSVSAVVDN